MLTDSQIFTISVIYLSKYVNGMFNLSLKMNDFCVIIILKTMFRSIKIIFRAVTIALSCRKSLVFES